MNVKKNYIILINIPNLYMSDIRSVSIFEKKKYEYGFTTIYAVSAPFSPLTLFHLIFFFIVDLTNQ